MRKILLILTLATLLAIPAQAFLYEIKVLTALEIKELTKEQLVEVYTEAKIEETTSKEFHIAAGFNSAKDYGKRKDLLRFIINLRREMKARDMTPEPIEEWLD